MINCKYTAKPEPSVATVMEAHGCHLRRPMASRPLMGQRLLRRAKGMRPLALGLGGWSVKDKRTMPPAVLSMLADFLRMVEQARHWPVVLVHRYTALVPK